MLTAQIPRLNGQIRQIACPNKLENSLGNMSHMLLRHGHQSTCGAKNRTGCQEFYPGRH